MSAFMEVCEVFGEPGSGKTYRVVKKLIEEVFPFYPHIKVLTNVPLVPRPEWADRCQVVEFHAGWLPPGDWMTPADVEEAVKRQPDFRANDPLDQMLEYLRDTIVIWDEVHRYFTKANVPTLVSLMGLARKRNTKWIIMTQDKETFPEGMDGLTRLRIECKNACEMRDETFGFRLGDIANFCAYFTKRYRDCFMTTEYSKINGRWTPLNKKPYLDWLRDDIAMCYDTKNGADVDEQGRPKVEHDYKKFPFWTFVRIAARRNAHVVPYFLFRCGAPLAMIGVGGAILWWQFRGRPRTPLVTEKPQVEVKQLRQPEAVRPQQGPVLPPVAAPKQVRSAVQRKVLTWAVLPLVLLLGCRHPAAPVSDGPAVGHVARRALEAEPRVAAYGPGHSLDGLLAEAGIKAATGMQVDGPIVGREVLDAARGAGFRLQGDSLVPSRKRAVPVPQELGDVEGSVSVGGYPVKLVSEDEVASWRELSAVSHEAYQTELLIVAVSASQSKELSAIASGQGLLSVSAPKVSGNPLSGKLSVALSMNGSSVYGREIARPVLTSAPGASADVHVGQRIPVKLATSSVTNQTTTTVGAQIQYITTGTQVSLQPNRVSANQVRLSGSVTLSEQTATVDGVPATSERMLSVDHLVMLDQWTVLGRLDSSGSRHGAGWIALGGLWSSRDETFLVLGRVIQVHRDERTHGVDEGPVVVKEKAVEPAKPELPKVEVEELPAPKGPEKPAAKPMSPGKGIKGKPNKSIGDRV